MWRVVTSTCLALTFVSSVASAQQPCTTDATRVVAEVYRHTLERGADAGAQTWQRQLVNGQLTVREIVRRVAKSNEYMQRFGRTEAGERQPYERAVSRLYRHVLGRQPDGNGLEHWSNVAQQRGLAAVVDGFVDSEEYVRNFGDWAVPGSGGVRFCQNDNTPTSDSSWTPRFRGMDRNNDGVITRSEWSGNNVSFDNQDWNNDGVLSGEEVRQGGRRAGGGLRRSDYDFDQLDANNNNRIERREWQARLDQFIALDTNNDNFLSRAEIEGASGVGTAVGRRADYDFDQLDANNNNRIERREWQARLDQFTALDTNNDNFLSRVEVEGTAGGRVGTSGGRVVVGGDRNWVDTGINVQAGDVVTITADGNIRFARDGGPVSAAGAGSGRVDGAPMPNAPVGGLIARFANSAPVFIGENRTIRAPAAGRLFLGVNDNYFDDNTGQFNVTVDVR